MKRLLAVLWLPIQGVCRLTGGHIYYDPQAEAEFVNLLRTHPTVETLRAARERLDAQPKVCMICDWPEHRRGHKG